MPTKLYVLVVIVLDCRNGMQVLAYEVAQYAVACAVQDTHSAHSNQCSVINKVHYGLNSLITTHTANIDIRLECQFAVVYVIVGLFAHVCCSADILHLNGFGVLQAAGLYRCCYLAESNGYVVFVYSNHFTDLGLARKTDCIANFE